MESITLNPVTPTTPIAAYIGGKRLLANRIIERINDIPHKTYIEPFIGMGGVFLRRNLRPPYEVINDYNKDVANLFRVIQRHYDAFEQALCYQITCRNEFYRQSKVSPDSLTDIERAVRFLYLQRLCYGGRGYKPTFSIYKDQQPKFNPKTLKPLIRTLHERITGVVIECLDFEDLIRRYDRADGKSLFYLDPPYYGVEGYYGKELFCRDDFARMVAVLKSIKGRFILSLNDHPNVRELFKDFDFEQVQLNYSLGLGKKGSPSNELLISN